MRTAQIIIVPFPPDVGNLTDREIKILWAKALKLYYAVQMF